VGCPNRTLSDTDLVAFDGKEIIGRVYRIAHDH
jgi:hypothetical protein